MTPLHRNRDFLLLWSGQTVSSIGTSMAAVAYPLIALAVTQSATTAGAVAFCGVAAMVAGSLPAGVWADRYSGRVLMIGCHLLRAGAAVSVAAALAAGRLTIAHLIVATVVAGFLGPAGFASETIAIRRVVPAPQLGAAIAQNDARSHLAELLGQPLSGYLYALGAALPIAGDAVSFLVAAATVAGLRTDLRQVAIPASRASMLSQISVGLRHIWGTRFLRTTLVCSAGINVAFTGLTLAVIASRSGAGSAHLGTALGLGAIGGLAGSWLSTRILHRLRARTVIIGFGWLVAAALAAMAVVTNVYALGALIAVIYFVTAPANGVLYASQILITPPELQGRVISAAVTLLGVTGPLGPLLAGVLVDVAGQWAAFGAFAVIVAVSTVALQRSRDVRDMPDLRPDATPEPNPAPPSDSDPTVSGVGADSIAA